VPPDLEAREWGFLSFDDSGMRRHKSFSSRGELSDYVRSIVPRHVYHSAAYYQRPGAPTMKEKLWTGADLIFDLDAVLFPGFRVMAQLGFDDISTKGLGIGDSDIPTIFAGIAGLQYTRALSFATLDLYAEAGYTHYLWGSFNDKWYLGRAIYRLELDRDTHALPLTSPFGPGTVWASFEAALEDWAGFTARLAAELVFRNPQASLTGAYAASGSVAAADLEGTLRVGGELAFHRWKWWEAYAEPVFFYRDSGSWFELALGAAVELDWRRPVRKVKPKVQE